MDARRERIGAFGTVTMPDALWDRTKKISAVIAPLATQSTVGTAAVDAAALSLGISRRQVYVLIKRYRDGTGLLTDLAPARSSGGKGTWRLSAEVEDLVREMVRKQYLNRQKRSLAAIYRDVVAACRLRQLPVPARNTVARRIRALSPVEVGRRRGGPDAVRSLQSAGGDVPVIGKILEQVQIDHTVIDVIVVDERERRPIGRPYLTAAIDVFSRSLVGMVVTLEAPSAVSVGLCLVHAATDKRPGLESLGVDVQWPMSGKPRQLYLDNASEFKNEALRRGCEQHGIELAYRPPGRPHYGGIVERVIGTAMQQVHELPGTTFSNPAERGRYDSDRRAMLTLHELEKWLTLAVATYHGSIHSTLGQTPAGRWAEGVEKTGTPAVVSNARAFLVDFLPVIRRTLTRTGFVIDHVHYFSNALKPWISRRSTLDPFLWISVVFLQGLQARSVLTMIERRGASAAIEYLRNWDHGKWTTAAALNDGYVYDRIPAGLHDRTIESDGLPYALTYSTTSGYVSLLRRHPRESELQIVRAPKALALHGSAETWTAPGNRQSTTAPQHPVSL